MGAADFVQEMRWVGQRLLLKLQRLPQAEPVEIVAFSVILLFTGQPGSRALLGSSRHPGGRGDHGTGWGGGGDWEWPGISQAGEGSRRPLGESWGKRGISPGPGNGLKSWAGWCWDQKRPALCPRDEGPELWEVKEAPQGGGPAPVAACRPSGTSAPGPGSGQSPPALQRGFWEEGGALLFPPRSLPCPRPAGTVLLLLVVACSCCCAPCCCPEPRARKAAVRPGTPP